MLAAQANSGRCAGVNQSATNAPQTNRALLPWISKLYMKHAYSRTNYSILTDSIRTAALLTYFSDC